MIHLSASIPKPRAAPCNASNGRIKGVLVDISEGPESMSHLVSPEDALRIAMARQ
jgi:hypothetical protein